MLSLRRFAFRFAMTEIQIRVEFHGGSRTPRGRDQRADRVSILRVIVKWIISLAFAAELTSHYPGPEVDACRLQRKH